MQAGLAVAEALGGLRRPWTRAERIRAHPSGPGRRQHDRRLGHLSRDGGAPAAAAPKQHALKYRAFWMLFDLDELPSLGRSLKLFAL